MIILFGDRADEIIRKLDTLLDGQKELRGKVDIIMSKTDNALEVLANTVVEVLNELDAARQEAADQKARADAVIANDAAEDAAQFEAIDTATSEKLDAYAARLRAALAPAEIPVEAPEDPVSTEPTEPETEPSTDEPETGI